MRIAIASRHLPDVEGSAAGRVLEATRRGLVQLGVDVTVLSWGPEPPRTPLPDGCDWSPLPSEPALRTRARALRRPRTDAVRSPWRPPDDAVLVADDPLSHALLDGRGDGRVVTTVHYLTSLDRSAVGRRRAADLQDVRAERRVVRDSAGVLAYSARVAEVLGRWSATPVATVPAAVPVPDDALPVVEAPVAGLLADWGWPPNRWALDVLLRAWPEVRRRVPTARLLLGGRGDAGVGTLAGVEHVGQVARSEDLLARLAVLAFPCPPSSGPKVKVLEALAGGLAVVTTPAGVEGVEGAGEHVWVADPSRFADHLAGALADPAARAARASAARAGVGGAHGPRPAAERRLAALDRLLGRGG